MRFVRVAGVGGAILGLGGQPATHPVVRLAHTSPVVITGAGYTAGAKFYVTYRSGTERIRRDVVASLDGRYRVVLSGVTFERCTGLRLTAPGASLRLAPCGKR